VSSYQITVKPVTLGGYTWVVVDSNGQAWQSPGAPYASSADAGQAAEAFADRLDAAPTPYTYTPGGDA
jgi:hypothetical protein